MEKGEWRGEDWRAVILCRLSRESLTERLNFNKDLWEVR